MKKIMFNDKYGLTEAVLNGKKTQTRRLVASGKIYNTTTNEMYEGELSEPYQKKLVEKFSRYKVGEVVAVAQKYKDIAEYLPQDPIALDTTSGFDNFSYEQFNKHAGWNNKMFVKAEDMPHHIRITNIRVERLQDISDEDCLAEGVQKVNFDVYVVNGIYVYDNGVEDGHYVFDTPKEAYAALIDKVSGKGTWESNPWVFVYEFELVD